jgi:Zn-finger nucleic acid-binding protein
MIQSTEAGITLDRCRDGHGIWFDLGEVRKYLLEHKVRGANDINDTTFKMAMVGAKEVCPCCRNLEFRLGSIRGATFQRCGWCGGIFVSSSQLQVLRESSKNQMSTSEFTSTDILDLILEFLEKNVRIRIG